MQHDPFTLVNSNLLPKFILQYHTPASAYTDKQQLKINCILCHTTNQHSNIIITVTSTVLSVQHVWSIVQCNMTWKHLGSIT